MNAIHPMPGSLRFGGSSLWWYVLLTFLAIFITVLSMGAGLWSLSADHLYHEISHMAFAQLCHQQVDRSLELNGLPMAVCSRCFGIYSSLPTGLILFPLFIAIGFRYRQKQAIHFIMASVVIIGIDFLGNLFGFWINTHLSRIILGASLGLSLAWLLAGQIKPSRNHLSHE
jgi:uncharacterized membrane protein